MVLQMKVKLAQSKKAYTQYISIPADIVRDSQYPFKGNEELNLTIEPAQNMIIISRDELSVVPQKDILVENTPKGILVKSSYKDLSIMFYIRHPSEKKVIARTKEEI